MDLNDQNEVNLINFTIYLYEIERNKKATLYDKE